MRKIFLVCLILLLPVTLCAETLSIVVSKESSNLYQEKFGADRYIKTLSCSENASNDNATLTMNGTTGTIQFSSGTTCTVSGAFSNLSYSENTYSTQVSIDTENWYKVDSVPTLRIKTENCFESAYSEAVTLEIFSTGYGSLDFGSTACTVTGIYGEETFAADQLGNVALYYPHVDTTNGWETEICLINTDATATLSGSLKAYNNDGTIVSSNIPIDLAPLSRREITVSAEFTNPSDIGYIIFESDDSNATGYTKFYVDGTYRVAVPAVSDLNGDQILISHIASDSDWWTGLSLVNTTNAEKILTVNFDNGETKHITIPAHGHQAMLVRNFFEGTEQPGIYSATINNAAGVIGLELFGSWGGGSMLSGVLLKDDTASSLYYPHIDSGTDWWTGIVAYNPNYATANLTVTPFSADGTSLQSQAITLNGNEKYIGVTDGLSFPAETAWFQIESDYPISGFELFGTRNGQQLAGYTGVNINRTDGIFPKLEQAGWTGLAFVNISNQTATVTLSAYDDWGTEIDTATLALNGHAKVVNIAQSLFNQPINDATYIKFTSDQEVVGFQLNGSDDEMLLDGLPGM